MSIRNFGRIVWIASLLASVALVGMPAFAQDTGEKRFKLSAPEPQQPAPDPSAPGQPAAAKKAEEPPAPSQTVPAPSVPSTPMSPAQPLPDQSGGNGASAAGQEKSLAEEPAAVPEPEDDLPPPMNAERGAGQPAATAQGVQSRQPAGKPLEIVPIREGKLSNLSTEGGQKAAPAKSTKPAKTAKIGKSGQPGQTMRPSTARPFWLDSRRHAADLSFKQGQVAFILGADIGRRGAYKTFLLDNPPRRVVDIPGRWRYDGPTNHRVRFDGVGSIRVGEHTDFLRIVFDYVQGEARPPLVHTTPDGISVIYFWGE